MKKIIIHKIRAFTLIELLIAMVISGLVISIGYTGWMLIKRQQVDYELRTEKYLELTRFEGQLRRDIDLCEMVFANDSVLICLFPIKKIQYCFYDSLLLRKGFSGVDTFLVNTEKPDINRGESNRFMILKISISNMTYCIQIIKEVNSPIRFYHGRHTSFYNNSDIHHL